MKKRIALFANGWSGEFLQELGQGLRPVAAHANADIFAFVNYTIHAESEENRIGEFNIFKLPDFSMFDGALIMANTFNMQMEIDYVHRAILESKIPAISLEYKLDGIDYFGTDDYSGMYDTAEHLIVDHGVKDILFIGGMSDHDASNIRLKAVIDSAKSHNIDIPDDNVIYGNFSAAPATKAFEEWLCEHANLPDAIICANDIMAIGICEWLKAHKYVVPRDVKVTGFDCLEMGLEYDPSITSVNREWIAMGQRCMEKLLAKIEGKTVSAEEEISTHLFCGESCGCNYDFFQSSRIRKKYGIQKAMDGFSCDQHFRHMYLTMRKTGTAEQLNESLSAFLLKEGWIEGNDFMLAFHPNFFISDSWDSIRMEGFPDEMNIVCHVHDKQAAPITKMNTQEAIFHIADKNDKPGVYIFVPIRVDEISLGFAVLSKGFSIFQNDILYIWCRHVSQYTEQIKSNVMIEQLTQRLHALSVTDALTGVYNRTGCETIMYPALINNQQKNGRSVLMIADLDRLKPINDIFGHGNGDLAISLSVKALQSALPKDYMIGRYGGDEFLIVGCEKDIIDTNELIQKVDYSLKSITQEHKTPFGLSISIGAVQLEKGEPSDISECIQKADSKMYAIKAVHHAK